MSIKNEKSIKEDYVEELRGHIEHRATWFYFLIDEACKEGLDKEGFARRAVRRCGSFHGENKLARTDSLKEFADSFLPENTRKIFEMDVDVNEKRLIVDFHYCPLVAAWKKLTKDEKAIDEMCDLAMEGDRGIISTYDKFEFDLQKTIASGDNHCRLVITKKE
jgi:hypothetical protein